MLWRCGPIDREVLAFVARSAINKYIRFVFSLTTIIEPLRVHSDVRSYHVNPIKIDEAPVEILAVNTTIIVPCVRWEMTSSLSKEVRKHTARETIRVSRVKNLRV